MSDLPAKTVTLSHQVGSREYSRKVRSDAEWEIKALLPALARFFNCRTQVLARFAYGKHG
jgi:hypothetical protein